MLWLCCFNLMFVGCACMTMFIQDVLFAVWVVCWCSFVFD